MSDPQAVALKEVLAWRVPEPAHAVNAAREIARKTGTFVILLGPGESLESLGEAEMAAHGWVRGHPRSGLANL